MRLDGERVWPPADGEHPASTIHTREGEHQARLVFGSCRVGAPQREPYTLPPDERRAGLRRRRPVGVLPPAPGRHRALARRAAPDAATRCTPTRCRPETLEFIRSRRDMSRAARRGGRGLRGVHPPLSRGVDRPRHPLAALDRAQRDDLRRPRRDRRLEHLVAVARGRPQPAVVARAHHRRVHGLLALPAPREPGAARARARSRCTARRRGRRGRRPGSCEAFAEQADRESASARWACRRDFGRSRVLVVDSRAARVLDDDHRDMVDDGEWEWIVERSREDLDHLVIVSTLPVFMSPGVHYLEAWNEAVCAGAWGGPAALGRRAHPARARPRALAGVPGVVRADGGAAPRRRARRPRAHAAGIRDARGRRHPQRLRRRGVAGPVVDTAAAASTSSSARPSATRSARRSGGSSSVTRTTVAAAALRGLARLAGVQAADRALALPGRADVPQLDRHRRARRPPGRGDDLPLGGRARTPTRSSRCTPRAGGRPARRRSGARRAGLALTRGRRAAAPPARPARRTAAASRRRRPRTARTSPSPGRGRRRRRRASAGRAARGCTRRRRRARPPTPASTAFCTMRRPPPPGEQRQRGEERGGRRRVAAREGRARASPRPGRSSAGRDRPIPFTRLVTSESPSVTTIRKTGIQRLRHARPLGSRRPRADQDHARGRGQVRDLDRMRWVESRSCAACAHRAAAESTSDERLAPADERARGGRRSAPRRTVNAASASVSARPVEHLGVEPAPDEAAARGCARGPPRPRRPPGARPHHRCERRAEARHASGAAAVATTSSRAITGMHRLSLPARRYAGNLHDHGNPATALPADGRGRRPPSDAPARPCRSRLAPRRIASRDRRAAWPGTPCIAFLVVTLVGFALLAAATVLVGWALKTYALPEHGFGHARRARQRVAGAPPRRRCAPTSRSGSRGSATSMRSRRSSAITAIVAVVLRKWRVAGVHRRRHRRRGGDLPRRDAR